MVRGVEMDIGELIAELEKPPIESRYDREELMAHLIFLSWFRNNTGRRARAYLEPNSVPFILTKEMLVKCFSQGLTR